MTEEKIEAEGKKKHNSETSANTSESCDFDINQIISYQRSARNELILRFLSLVLLSFTFGLVLLQINILWRSRESFQVMDMAAHDRRLLGYPKFYQVPHSEETWCWDPDTLLLKVNTSIFVR